MKKQLCRKIKITNGAGWNTKKKYSKPTFKWKMIYVNQLKIAQYIYARIQQVITQNRKYYDKY